MVVAVAVALGIWMADSRVLIELKSNSSQILMPAGAAHVPIAPRDGNLCHLQAVGEHVLRRVSQSLVIVVLICRQDWDFEVEMAKKCSGGGLKGGNNCPAERVGWRVLVLQGLTWEAFVRTLVAKSEGGRGEAVLGDFPRPVVDRRYLPVSVRVEGGGLAPSVVLHHQRGQEPPVIFSSLPSLSLSQSPLMGPDQRDGPIAITSKTRAVCQCYSIFALTLRETPCCARYALSVAYCILLLHTCHGHCR